MPLAALGAVLIALMALLLIAAIYELGKALAQIFPSSIGLPGVHIHPRAWVESGVAALGDVLRWILGDVVRPLITLILSPVNNFLHWLTQVAGFMLTVADEIEWLVTHGIPQGIGRAVTVAHQLVASALAHMEAITAQLRHDAAHWVDAAKALAAHQLAAAVHHLEAITGQLRHDAAHWVDAAKAVLGKEINDVRHLVTSELHAAESYTDRAISDVRGLIKADVAVAEKYADTVTADAVKAMQASLSTAVAGVIHVVDVDAIAPLAAAWPGVLDDLGALGDVIATDLPDIGAAVRAIPRAVPTDLAGAMTIVGAISVPMLRYMTRCGIPNCRNLSSLGRELTNLLDDLAGGALFGLLIALVADPIGAAHFLHDDIGPIATEAIHEAQSLLGV